MRTDNDIGVSLLHNYVKRLIEDLPLQGLSKKRI